MSNDPLFRMKVDDVFFIDGRGTVAVGRIEQGTLSVGDEVDIHGSGGVKRAVVAALEMLYKTLNQANAGDDIGVVFKDIAMENVKCGDMLTGVGGARSPLTS